MTTKGITADTPATMTEATAIAAEITIETTVMDPAIGKGAIGTTDPTIDSDMAPETTLAIGPDAIGTTGPVTNPRAASEMNLAIGWGKIGTTDSTADSTKDTCPVAGAITASGVSTGIPASR